MNSPSNHKQFPPHVFSPFFYFCPSPSSPPQTYHTPTLSHHTHYPFYNYLCEIASCRILIINNLLTAVSPLSFVLVLLPLLFLRTNLLRHRRLSLKAIRSLPTVLIPSRLMVSRRPRALDDLLSLMAPHPARSIPGSRFMYAHWFIDRGFHTDIDLRDSILPVLLTPVALLPVVLPVVRRPDLADMVRLEARPRPLRPSKSPRTVSS